MEKDNYDLVVAYIIKNQVKFYRLAYTYVNCKEDALDVVQNAICKALEGYEKIRNIESIKTWFYRVLVNESINYIKWRKREAVADMQQVGSVYIEKGYEPSSGLYEEINRLPLDVQVVIKLRFYEDMSLKEICEIVDLNLNTVKAKLYRGLRSLKHEMNEEVWL